MEIEELVESIKNNCTELEELLYNKLDEFNKRGLCDLRGEKDADVRGIQYQNEIVGFIKEEQSIYDAVTRTKKVARKTAETEKMHLATLIKLVDATLYDIEEYVSEKEETLKEAEEEDEEVVHTAKTKKARRGLFFFLGGVTGAALLAAALLATCQIKSCNTQRSNSGIEQSTEEDEEKTTEVPNTKDDPTESSEEEKTTEATEETEKSTEAQLVPGEYGTFTDINDEEQVEARAQYIIDNYFSQFMDKLSPNERAIITKENVANTIRTMNDSLPLDENGNKTKDGVTVDTYGQAFLEMGINNPSSKQLDKYYHVPLHLFAVDNSELSEFIKSYDGIYDKMIHGLNVGDDVEVQDAIACLGYKFWNEWFLQGADGSFNPHNLHQAVKYFAWQATLPKYQVTGLESNINAQRPVCIEVCYPYGSTERKAITVDSIYAALDSGAWNHISAQLAGMEVPNNPWLPLFWQSLEDDLNWQYEHQNTLKLN